MCLSHSFLKAGLTVDDWRQQGAVGFISNEKVMKREREELAASRGKLPNFPEGWA